MTEQTDTQATELVEAAEAAVAEFEGAVVGNPWKEISAAASKAVARLSEYAAALMFPSAPVPVGADVAADFELHTKETLRAEYGKELAQLHLCALDINSALATFLRSAVVCRRVRMMGAGMAGTYNRPGAELATEALQQYQQAIAAQLHDRDELEPLSRIVAVDLPALEARITAVTEPHETHDAEERKGQHQARLEQRKDLAMRFQRLSIGVQLSGARFGRVGGTFTAQAVAELIRQGAVDNHLDFLGQWLIDEGLRDSRHVRRDRAATA